MILAFRPIKVQPPSWRAANAGRPSSPFYASYSDTLGVLDRELHQMGATDVHLQVDVDEADVRLDGQLRANASPRHPGVMLTVSTRRRGTVVFSTDRFNHWHANLRAIALGMEALRKVERYGIADQGQQYAGYRELGAGTPLGAGMSVEEAARFIADHHPEPALTQQVAHDPLFALSLWRDVARTNHPDVGGDPEVFRRLVEARDLLKSAREAA